MKKYTHSVLIIDDHPLISEAYKNALNIIEIESESAEISFGIETANNCDTAFAKIKESAKKRVPFDLIFLDIKLPPSKEGKIRSGEDLGIRIKSLLPNSKIIISTTFNDNYRIHSIFQSLSPDGFLIKNDINPQELITAIKAVISNSPYYSITVVKMLKKEVSNDLLIDKVDRALLYELSIGTKTKSLPNIIPLSIAGIEKRKRHLKELFDITKQDDKTLISVAREKGFV
ncbi:MAG: response regulator transcription factor [Polaribacter sp.]|nr:response regulator transcription factor [Polaribacter sp.]